MNKQAFLEQLQFRLSNLPPHDIAEHMAFYSEMIDDRMDNGMSEEEAVAAMGHIDSIAMHIVADTPLSVLVKETVRPKRRLPAWEIVLIILGFPLWFSLLVSVFAVMLSLYISLWAMIVSLWSVFGAVAASAFGTLVGGGILLVAGYPLSGLALIACSLVCAGSSILFFFGCKAATNGLLWLTKISVKGLKRLFIKKEDVQ